MSKILKKSLLFKKSENFENIFFFRQKNAILLVLPIKEISLPPELASPARFKIQGGYPEHDIHRKSSRTVLQPELSTQPLFRIQGGYPERDIHMNISRTVL